jgi:hypothetical protein
MPMYGSEHTGRDRQAEALCEEEVQADVVRGEAA